jgi:protein ImuB
VRRIACLLLPAEQVHERDGASAARLLEVALAYSPRVEEAGPDAVYLDVAGLGQLFGSEIQIAQGLVREAAERGVRVHVGIAGSRIGALVSARRAHGIAVVEADAEAHYLASAALSLLDLPEDMAARLRQWGMRTLGELASLPTPALFERLGSEGVRWQRLARGEDLRPLRPWTPPPVFEQSIAAGWAMESLEHVGEFLTKLAEEICERLVRRGLSADQFRWTCHLTDHTVHEGSCSPAVPINEAAAVAALLRASLAAHPPRGAVEAVALRAHVVRAASIQDSLLDGSRPRSRVLAATLARLASSLGQEQIGTPVLVDSYRPDAVEMAPLPLSRADQVGVGKATHPVLALRRLRPRCPADVVLADGHPTHLRSDRLTARIATSVGPWRVSGEWWTERPWAQDEWDVELADGTLGRLAHDGAQWWLEGLYD